VNAQERFAELWTDYLEGDLEESGVVELRGLLEADESLVQHAADLLQTHRLLGLVVREEPARQDEFVRQTMALLPKNHDEFVGSVMLNVERVNEGPQKAPSAGRGRFYSTWIAAALVVVVAGLLFSFWPKGMMPVAGNGDPQGNTIVAQGFARLASSSHAKFFGELAPPVGSALASQREYVLMSGLVEIAFPDGATAILEGPAVFRVLSPESLALDVGHCSVHAPDGAEGFRVETPITRVVDRGTRFAVNVAETSETEVQVIEGAADVYEKGPKDKVSRQRHSEIRLTDGQASRFAPVGDFAADAVPFDASVYRSRLPDRVVSYKATQAADGGAENLLSVTVQRGGQVAEVPAEELIPARVTWFKATASRAFLCGGAKLPSPRIDALSDRSLITGVINPDGSCEPLTASPVIEGDAGTPGLAVRFERPVVNGPGADVVLFDLQTFANPPNGDAFHVSPLLFRDGLKSHTIRKYDLTMESPEARDLTNFYVYFFRQAADSPGKLESLECSSQKQANKFRGLAVGIDLSDLGYAAGETVDGLFFQDALDDEYRMDPVFIGGLPEAK
jgi:hypothetical protein